MIDFNARHIIEALRSGISSREVGYCFSSARPKIIRDIDCSLSKSADEGFAGGMTVSGNYGEGKTHLLNTVFNMAHERNMVVSFVSLNKETPFDKLYTVYSKIVQNTYLPGRFQPGFENIFESMTQKSPLASELCEHCLKDFETNKLYYVLKSYLGTEDMDEKFMLLADMEGGFINNGDIKKIYGRIYSEKVNFNANFVKSRHTWDYFSFLNILFLKSGYNGWMILFDEAELMGKLSKKARLNCYLNMSKFIFPDKNANLKSVYSIFTFNSSFCLDVIEGKFEYENLEQNPISPEADKKIKTILKFIDESPQLDPLNKEEILAVLEKIRDFHKKAYDWDPNIETDALFSSVGDRDKRSPLRTRIRAAVEILDQLYQYGKAGNITVNELGHMDYSENPSIC